MTDDEILTPGRLEFPNGGMANVHEVRNGQVYYALRWPGGDEWSLFRKDIPLFLDGVRHAAGYRPEGDEE